MTVSEKNFIMFTIFVIVISSVLSPCTANSPIERLVDYISPVVTVNFMNNASHDVALMCDHKGYDNNLHILKTNATVTWKFRDLLFPLKWCYIYINEENQGVFWAYMVRFKCKQCMWSMKDDGLYFTGESSPAWTKYNMNVNGEYF